MVADFIELKRTDTAAVFVSEILAYRASIATALAQGDAIKNKMAHMFNDSIPQAIDWTMLERLYGIPTGKGQAVWDMINGSQGAMRGTMQNNQCENLVKMAG